MSDKTINIIRLVIFLCFVAGLVIFGMGDSYSTKMIGFCIFIIAPMVRVIFGFIVDILLPKKAESKKLTSAN